MGKFSPRQLIETPGRLSYHDMILKESGLVSYWNFGAGQGNKLWNQKGTNHGDITGATWTQKANGLYTLGFDGNDYVDTNLSTNFSGTSNFTVEGWFKGDTDTTYYGISQTHTVGPYSSDWILPYVWSGHLVFFRGVFIDPPSGFSPLVWFHLVMVWNISTERFEVFTNGVSVGVSDVVSDYGGINSIKIGSRGDASTSFYDGVSNEIAIYNIALSPETIRKHYQVGIWEGLA